MDWQANQALWNRLGRDLPWYSVVAEERFRGVTPPPEDFWESGRRDVETVLSQVRAVVPDFCTLTVLELACGVGRMSRALLPHCGRLIAADWSEAHLALARQHAPGPVYFHLADKLAYRELPTVDVALSVITLQHNPPEAQLEIIGAILAALAPGGVALFQTATQGEPIPPGPDFGLWSCPAPSIFRAIALGNCVPLDVFTDSWTGAYGRSTTFIARKSLCG